MQHLLRLPVAEERRLHALVRKGKTGARVLKRAHIILNIHEGLSDANAARAVRMCAKTAKRIRKRYHEGGLPRALYDAQRPGQPKKTTAKDDAYLVAVACTDAPEGRRYWTLDLLQEVFTQKKKIPLSRSAIHVRLAERNVKPWREKNVVHSGDHAGVH